MFRDRPLIVVSRTWFIAIYVVVVLLMAVAFGEVS